MTEVYTSADPKQIVCTGPEIGDDQWHPAFGTWSADDFGIDSKETVGAGERLYVRRDLYDAIKAQNEAQAAEIERRTSAHLAEMSGAMAENDRLREVAEQAHMLLCYEFQSFMKPPSQTDGRYEESMKVWNLEPAARAMMCAARADLYDALMTLKGGDA